MNKILLQILPIHGRKECEVVIRSQDICDLLAAVEAAVDDHPALASAEFLGDRFHQSFARRCAVPGAVFIHVLAPETLWAVVAAGGVFQRLHVRAAVSADERFLAGEEGHEICWFGQVSNDHLREETTILDSVGAVVAWKCE